MYKLLIVAAVIASVAAQLPPTNFTRNCNTLQANAFCFPYVKYQTPNANVNQSDLAASNAYNSTLYSRFYLPTITFFNTSSVVNTTYNVNGTIITNSTIVYTITNTTTYNITITPQCSAAMATYFCQRNLPKCGLYGQTYSNVSQSICDNLALQCAGNVTAQDCSGNLYSTTDGNYPVCYNAPYVGLGSGCVSASNFDNLAVTSTVSVTQCAAPNTCISGTCTQPSAYNSACTTTCTQMTGPNTIAPRLSCIQNRCLIPNRRGGSNCTFNQECSSNNCAAGQCVDKNVDETCTSNGQCGLNTFCNTVSGRCEQLELPPITCGLNTGRNTSEVLCNSNQFVCVNGTSGAVCTAYAQQGQRCSTTPLTGTTAVYPLPTCLPILSCLNGMCVDPNARAPLGGACNSTLSCDLSATCRYTGSSTQGVCDTPSNVACDTQATPNDFSYVSTLGLSRQCNAYQFCSCSSSNSTGVCAPAQIDVNTPVCISQKNDFTSCAVRRCEAQAINQFYPYSNDRSCVSTSCSVEIDNYYCCVTRTLGSSYVAPAGFNSNFCNTNTVAATPTPSIRPTTRSPIQTSAPTPTPTSSSVKTMASTMVMVIVGIATFALVL
ncbi:acetyl-CoA hydrolase [Acrasis kona]|uniref:Acetyl-CoA hydrolase n=1 Tax=Acrasis kona TaxID=1008807 RepID=A0AAW2YNW8_9EUKA